MQSIMNSIRDREQTLKQLLKQQVFSDDQISVIRKEEKQRIFFENRYLGLLQRYQQVSNQERITFLLLSGQFMNLPPIMHSKGIYDQIGYMYITYFESEKCWEKAEKIRLIQSNEMHKNQAFILLLVKWLIDHQRSQYLGALEQLKSAIKYPTFQAQRLIARTLDKPFYTIEQQELSHHRREESNVLVPRRDFNNNSSIQPSTIFNFQKRRNFSTNSKGESLGEEIQSQRRKTQHSVLEKFHVGTKENYQWSKSQVPVMKLNLSCKNEQKGEEGFRLKKTSLQEQLKYYSGIKELIGDLDMENVKVMDRFQQKLFYQRNQSIKRGIVQYMLVRKGSH